MKVVFSNGKTSVENVNNVNRVDVEDAEPVTGPTMSGALVEVMFTMTDGSEQWFEGRVTRINFDDSVLIKWSNGDKASSVDLWHPSIKWRYCTSDSTPAADGSLEPVEEPSEGACC